MLGNGFPLFTMASDTSDHSRRFSSINTPRRGLIFEISTTAMRITSRTRFWLRRRTNNSVLICTRSFPITRTTFGESLHRIPQTATSSGAGRLQPGQLMGRSCHAPRGGSLPFLPQQTIQVLQTIKDKYGKRAWCRYGFVDAFNPLTNWYDTDVIGIDTGITMVMAENARSGFVWNTFMKNPEAIRGMARAGFRPNGPGYQFNG